MDKKYPFKKAASMLKVMAHPVRMNIISLLEGRSLNVGQIQKELGIKQSITSQHLSTLTDKDILKREKRGNEAYFAVKKKEVLKLMACIKKCC